MDNAELLKRLEITHNWTSDAILELRELDKNKNNFTQQAIATLRNDTLKNVQLAISEMEILAMELEVN